jgi:hypothetical protein
MLGFSITMSFSSLVYAVPVVPNESVVKGTVMECYSISSPALNIKPEQTLYTVLVLIEDVKNIKGSNFLEGKQGQSILFYTKEKLPLELIDKKVEAIVKYTGDERGGLFWIMDIYTLN